MFLKYKQHPFLFFKGDLFGRQSCVLKIYIVFISDTLQFSMVHNKSDGYNQQYIGETERC